MVLNLLRYVDEHVECYEGVDVVRYPDFPADKPLYVIDLDTGKAHLPDNYADVVVSVETIEHLENPRAFFREMLRLCRVGGTAIVRTPNQLSFLSLGTLIVKHRFQQFTDSSYPAHITALLEVDLLRIANECGLSDIGTRFSRSGRIPLTARSWPRFFSNFMPRQFSESIAVFGKKTVRAREWLGIDARQFCEKKNKPLRIDQTQTKHRKRKGGIQVLFDRSVSIGYGRPCWFAPIASSDVF